MSGSVQWLYVVSGAVLALGLLLSAIGLRGRLSHRGPHCRACRFDLSGIDGRCPECGADLKSPGAVTTGLRTRRRGMLAVGLILFLTGAGCTGGLLHARGKGFNWNSVKPAWLLIRELRSVDIATADAAMVELERRHAANALPAASLAQALDQAIIHQADPTAAWSPAWGSLIETSRNRGQLTAPQLDSYFRHLCVLDADCRPSVAAGGTFPIRIRTGNGRTSPASPLRIAVSLLGTTDGPTEIQRGGGAGIFTIGSGGWGSLTTQATAIGPPGKHTLKSRWKVEIKEGIDGPPLSTWEETFDLDLEVLPDGSPTVELITDESLRATIDSTITIDQLELGYRSGTQRHVSGTVSVQSAPMDMAFDVIWVDPAKGTEWNVGRVSFRSSGGGSGHGLSGFVPADFNLSQVDVVLRPSPAAAAGTVDLTRIWNGEIRRNGLPVKDPDTQATDRK